MTAIKEASETTLGAILRRERANAGLSVRGLSEQSGISVGQLSKLENDRVKKPNPAHLALLAGPLGLHLYTLYAAAGYASPGAIRSLEPELIARLEELPSDSLDNITHFLSELLSNGQATWEGPLLGQRTVLVEAKAFDEEVSDSERSKDNEWSAQH